MSKILDKFDDMFNHYSDTTAGDGCETCNYGATPAMTEEAFHKLLEDIDKFSASFKPQE